MAEHHQHADHHSHHEHNDAHHHHHSSHQEDMLSVEEALEKILSYVSPMAPVEVALPDALGLTLAEEVTSPLDLPPLDNSAMDGFAVRYEDVAGAGQHSPVELPVIGYVQAGALPDRDLEPGSAIRIMTGAPIPPGANAVVPFEDTDEVERKTSGHALDRIRIMQEAPDGANVRPAGEDLRTGDRLMGPGVVLRPGEIGVLASVGRQRVTALRRPVVAILSTGDELLALGEAPGAGKIYDSNSFSIAAAVRRYGGEPWMLGIAKDTLEDTTRKLGEGITADLLITTAGVSKGDYDFIKDVLTANGEIAFWSVRMRPARPLAFGVLHAPDGRRVPHVGLPGNPVSALVAFEQFCRPGHPQDAGPHALRQADGAGRAARSHHQHGRPTRVCAGHRHTGGRALPGVADGAAGEQPAHLHGPRQRAGHLPGGHRGDAGGRRGGRADAGLAGGSGGLAGGGRPSDNCMNYSTLSLSLFNWYTIHSRRHPKRGS